jgi:mannosyltransferase
VTRSPSPELAQRLGGQALPSVGLPLVALAALAAALRLYRLDGQLWLDEIYTIQLVRLGPWAIWLNMAADPHPPLFYLSEWLASGFGLAQSPAAWRSLSVGCGVLAVALVSWIAWPVAGRAAALAGGLSLALSPTHIFFSQEARSSAMAVLLEALSLLLAARLLQAPSLARWLAYGLACFVGVATSYHFVIVPAAQLAALVLLRPTRRGALLCGLALGLACTPLLLAGRAVLSSMASAQLGQAPPSLLGFAQALTGGEPLRYGYTWGHSAVLLALSLLATLGVWPGGPPARRSLALLCLAQLGLPLLGFFGLAVPLGMRLPPHQFKVFITLLPALYVLVALGAARLLAWPARPYGLALLALLGALTIAGGSYNLARYWTMPKSPEAELVATLRAQAQPEDVAISLHYSTSAALSFYAPALTVYSRPERGPDGTRLARTAQIVAVAELTPPSDVPFGQIIRPGARAWLLFHTNQQLPAPFDMLAASCGQPAAIDYPPFRALLLADCR